ncbi:hypothetical protein ACO0QE_001156 [Hanseniaspora vineae]
MATVQEKLQTELTLFRATWNINKASSAEACARTAKLIEDPGNDLKLLHVVMSLREAMISEDETERKMGITFLSWTLANLDVSSLRINDCDVIFDFYFNKLQYEIEDSECLKEILGGLKSIISMKWFTNQKSLVKLLEFLKENYNPTQYLASVRYEMFLLVDGILDRFLNGSTELIKDNNQDSLAEMFIQTFLNVANGEKDPRNLLLSFKLNGKITTQLPSDVVYKHSQELFDTLFCYFPITFKPPKNDPYKITNADLKLALRTAISNCTFFDDDCFNNMIDKLAASSPSVKNDTLLTIKACIESYDFQSVLKFWLQIWEALKFDIMRNNSEDKFEDEGINNYQECINVVLALCRKFLEQKNGETFDIILKKIFQDLENNFINGKNLKQSCGILSSISLIDETSFSKVMKKVMPLFFNEKKVQESQSDVNLEQMKLLLLNLSFFFDSYITVFNDESAPSPKGNELEKYKDEILLLLSKALTGTSKNEIAIKTLSIVQFTKLVNMKDFLNESEVYMSVQYLTDSLLQADDKNIYHACLEGLKSITLKYEFVVKSLTVNKLLESLRSFSEGDTEKVLRIIIDFTCSKDLFMNECVAGLLDVVMEQQTNADYVFLLAGAIYKLVDSHNGSFDEHIQSSIVEKLYALVSTNEILFHEDGIIEMFSDILFQTLLKSSIQYQKTFYDLHVANIVTSLFSSPTKMVIVLSKILAALDVSIDISTIESHYQDIPKVIHSIDQSDTPDEFMKTGYYELVCILTNKNAQLLTQTCEEMLQQTNDIQLVMWAVKGLVLQNDKTIGDRISFLIRLLDDDRYGFIVSASFLILVTELPIFQKYKNTNNMNIKMLHKQKLFHITVPNLIENFKSSKNVELKSRYLTSLSYILKSTPIQIKSNFTVQLMPLLLEALNVSNSDVKTSSLQTIKDTLETQSDIIAQHIHTLVSQCLGLLDYTDEHNSIKVRHLSLEILHLFTKTIPVNYLQPYKTEIIKKLVVSLEDPRRMIRKLAIDTRESYYELGQVII